ncbi:hypothetical protein D3C73_1368180 [compost metagenome]
MKLLEGRDVPFGLQSDLIVHHGDAETFFHEGRIDLSVQDLLQMATHRPFQAVDGAVDLNDFFQPGDLHQRPVVIVDDRLQTRLHKRLNPLQNGHIRIR